MHLAESKRSRQLLVRLEQGDELPDALVRALARVEATSAFVTGTGRLEGVELAARGDGRTRRIDFPTDLVSLQGTVAVHAGLLSARLLVTVAREADVVAGELVWARVAAADLLVTTLDDVSLGSAVAPAPAAASPTPSPPPAAAAAGRDGPPIPFRHTRQVEEPEHYPENGDLVMHFHFGECAVIGSDGERIRLRQERDGRVREVALQMLKIEPPTVDEAGRRRFELKRKN